MCYNFVFRISINSLKMMYTVVLDINDASLLIIKTSAYPSVLSLVKLHVKSMAYFVCHSGLM